MKYLGIDYGKKRIGVAVSDEGAVMAFPLGTVENGASAMQEETALREVLDIVQENGVKIAVMGESRDLSGKPNPIMRDIESFAEKLQNAGIVVEFEPEFFTSAQAERQFGKLTAEKPRARKTKAPDPEHHDASAAALILQSYLDRRRKNG